jgi:hypothetical protein
VRFARNAGWVHCWLDRDEQLNKCRMYNDQGIVLWRLGPEDVRDDVFLPYGGGNSVPEQQLDIDPDETGLTYVTLRNGIILIPRQQYDFYAAGMKERLALRRDGRHR